ECSGLPIWQERPLKIDLPNTSRRRIPGPHCYGQPALQDDVILVVSGGTATLSRTEPSVNINTRTMVNVRVVDANPDTEVFVGSRSNEERGTWIAVPNVVIPSDGEQQVE
ncbi:hypothetical protein L9F63_014044, partial [Diploptera punctata]